ncbi:MAG: selenocysteine-specific translation elongation factor [Chloroflexi bacterium]|nr:selenocysteine-specific translation elongation factor [Chloroflexota bacterium]
MYVIGTAGHVDHGKSTLVKALTGIDPDRLQEEKDREMTIELGFAWFTLPSGREISVVDVPGHERFIKNMLAGVGGIDLAMLIVAADESVMPQTREHLAILDLLQVKRGIVVLTKADTVDEEWADLVRGEVEEALEGTTLEGAPMALVSAVTGQGLPELMALIDAMLEETVRREDLGRPRLAIDRSFVMPGFGTVVTGTLLDGALTVGQEVELLPSGLRRRIRGLQSHQQRIESVGPGNRVAVNLANTTQEEAERGQVLTLPGWLQPTTTVDVQIRMAPGAPMPIRHNLGVTFHAGTSESFSRVRLLDVGELRPGQEGWAQVHLTDPIPLVKGDYFVVRSSQWTLGGGRVVDPHPARHRRFQLGVLEKLEVMAEGSPEDLVLKALEGAEPCGLAALARAANLAVAETATIVGELAEVGDVVVLGGAPSDSGAVLMTTPGWATVRGQADAAVQAYHTANPLRPGLPREELRNRLKLSQAVFTLVLQRLADEGVLEETGAVVRAPGHRVVLSDAQEAEVARYVAALEREPYAPPTEIAIDAALVGVLAERGSVVRVNDSIVFAAGAYREIVDRIVAHLREHGAITVADVRDTFGTSRKYALPLLEHLDQLHVTRRQGDQRVLLRDPGRS